MRRIQGMTAISALALGGMILPLEAHASFAPTVVPEPATMALFATGLAGLGLTELMRRRKKK